MKLHRNQRWLSSEEFWSNEYGINANYPSNHHNYYSAWTYVTKQDENFVESAGHPDLKNAAEPKTSRNNKRKRNRGDEDDQESDDDKDTDSHTSRRSSQVGYDHRSYERNLSNCV